ncbi:transglutaminase-like cysteine peptidase [Tropicimonas sp. TH_r6]|uniref:transglutaminase-like cysteine peptidase n=1 Tax=Tropicimonas sp. TH_r6 TaxID=3082085 RepID=UPI002953EE84|nr:transglutaminase-like cysteine peptidase [Tropicimonas sp. TH_r6]MDV7144275.1 transglutaminase-like cysteine peptidase [Tropicimonas sp. TH_r6]
MRKSNAGIPDRTKMTAGRMSVFFLVALALNILTIGPVDASSYLPNRGLASVPRAAVKLCSEYSWACSRSGNRMPASNDALRYAKKVSRLVNRGTPSISDDRQYKVEDHWTLPSRRGGDCEDLALLKKQQMISHGIAPERLLLTTVLDTRGGPHAVLVFRTDLGDYVIDNLTDAVRPWDRTGYTFLRMQDPSTPSRWIHVNTKG